MFKMKYNRFVINSTEPPVNLGEAEKELNCLTKKALKRNRLGGAILYGFMSVVLLFIIVFNKNHHWVAYPVLALFIVLTIFASNSKDNEPVHQHDYSGKALHNRIKFLEGYIAASKISDQKQ